MLFGERTMIKLKLNGLIWVLFVFYLFTIIVFGDRVEYFRYSNITFVVLIGLMSIYIVGRSLLVPVKLFMFLPFLFYSFLSIIWSYMPDSSLQRSLTLLRLSVLLLVMAFYLIQSRQTEQFIYGIAVAGLIILLYVCSFYGLSGLRQMIEEGMRVGGEFVNSNTLAIYLSFSAVILFYLFLDKRKWYYILLAVGLVVLIASTGSKKGLLDLTVGFIMVTGLNQNSSNSAKKLFKWGVSLLIGAIILYNLWKSPLFSTVRDRYEVMFTFLSGTGARIDYSTRERQIMLTAGWQQFLRTPLFGIGIGASGYLTTIALGSDTYLHNEYIEILATGGIVGFFLQFIPIFYILVGNWKNRNNSRVSQMCSVLLAIYLVNGIAAVQYFSKLTYVIFAISLASYIENRFEEQHVEI